MKIPPVDQGDPYRRALQAARRGKAAEAAADYHYAGSFLHYPATAGKKEDKRKPSLAARARRARSRIEHPMLSDPTLYEASGNSTAGSRRRCVGAMAFSG